MKLSNVIDPRFNEAFNKLLSTQVSLATATKIKLIVNDLAAMAADYETKRRALLDEHGKKAADGKLETDEAGHAKFDSEDSAKTFMAEVTDLISKEVKVGKVPLSELSNMNVSTSEFTLLEELIDLTK